MVWEAHRWAGTDAVASVSAGGSKGSRPDGREPGCDTARRITELTRPGARPETTPPL